MKKIFTAFCICILSLVFTPNSVNSQFVDISTISPTPGGQTINLSFNLPGIGTESANFEPLHTTRDVKILFFTKDVDSQSSSVRPKGTLNGKAEFDSNPESPTYGSFVASNIAIGSIIEDGDYQIAFKTNQALSKVIKEKESNVGGKIFKTQKSFGQPIQLDGQTVIVGDIVPAGIGDNKIDITDYNALVECFGEKAESETCPDKTSADLDDNGTIDGVDYNLMFRSYNLLLSLGFNVPKLNEFPEKEKQVKEKPKSTSTNADKNTKTAAASSTNIFVIFIVVLFILMAIGGFIFFRIRRKKSLIQPPKPPAPESPQPTDNVQQPLVDTSLQPQEISFSSIAKDSVDKDFYIKKKSTDSEGTWLTLTDDSGQTLGLYKGSEVSDGFAHIKGIYKSLDNKTYIEISEIKPSAS